MVRYGILNCKGMHSTLHDMEQSLLRAGLPGGKSGHIKQICSLTIVAKCEVGKAGKRGM